MLRTPLAGLEVVVPRAVGSSSRSQPNSSRISRPSGASSPRSWSRTASRPWTWCSEKLATTASNGPACPALDRIFGRNTAPPGPWDRLRRRRSRRVQRAGQFAVAAADFEDPSGRRLQVRRRPSSLTSASQKRADRRPRAAARRLRDACSTPSAASASSRSTRSRPSRRRSTSSPGAGSAPTTVASSIGSSGRRGSSSSGTRSSGRSRICR